MNAQSLFAHLHTLLDATDPHIINHAEDREERIPVFHYAAAPAHADMAAGKAALADWLQIDEDTLDKDELGLYTTDEGAPAYYGFPDWWENAVVFAYFGYSPECLLMPADGAYCGKIFIFEHDGGNGISQIADNLSDLFRQLATDSIGFLRRYYGMYWYDATSYHSG